MYAPNQQPATLRENSNITDFINSIDGHLSAAQDILQRVDKLADRIGSPVPRDAGALTEPQTPEEPALNLRLRRKLSTLGSLQAAISGELARLEGSV